MSKPKGSRLSSKEQAALAVLLLLVEHCEVWESVDLPQEEHDLFNNLEVAPTETEVGFSGGRFMARRSNPDSGWKFYAQI